MTVIVTGVDGQFRTSDEAAERPMQVRYDQRIAKNGRVAEQNNLSSNLCGELHLDETNINLMSDNMDGTEAVNEPTAVDSGSNVELRILKSTVKLM